MLHYRSYQKFCVSLLKAELEKAQNLGVKDSYLTFQRKWNQLCEEVKNDKPKIWNDKLNATQNEKVELLVKHVSRLSMLELRYFNHILEQKITQQHQNNLFSVKLSKEQLESIGLFIKKIQILKIQKSKKTKESGIFPTAHPKWIMQQEALAKLWPIGQQGIATMLSDVMGGGGAGDGAASDGAKSQAEPEVKEIKKEEQKIEKKNYDIELTAYDSASKIKVIKEVRELFKLGLKEAKDLVDSAPCVLAKQVKTEDAEVFKKKLEDLKCKINLL